MIILGGKREGHTAAETVRFRSANRLCSVGPLGHTRVQRPPRVSGTGRASAASERFGATHKETRSRHTRRTPPGGPLALSERRGFRAVRTCRAPQRLETCACCRSCQTPTKAESPLSLVSNLRASVPGYRKCATRCPGNKEEWHFKAAT